MIKIRKKIRRTTKSIGIIGDFCINISTVFKENLKLNERLYVQDINLTIGGMAGLVAKQLAVLGAKTHAYGSIGYDEASIYLVSQLNKFGVNTEGLTRGKGNTGKNIVLIKDNTRTVVADFGVHTKYSKLRFNKQILNHIIYYIPGFPTYLELISQLAKKKKELFVDLGFTNDISSIKSSLDDILINAYLVAFSKKYFTSELFDIVVRSLNKSYKNIIVTDGGKGVYVLKPQSITYLPAYRTKIRDVCGAGDAFLAALIYKMSYQSNLFEAINFAQAVAALKISRVNYTPTENEVNKAYSLKDRRQHLYRATEKSLDYKSLGV